MSSEANPEVPYRALAEIYDRLYSWKDYEKESRIVRKVVERWAAGRAARTLLDLACGTGNHLQYLSKWFECTGLDPSPQMLAVARRKVPAARFVRGRMPRFDLGREFDVITCLFSSIGYLRNEAELRSALRTFSRHLAPGGVAILEPWLTPATWRPGSAHLLSAPSATEPIARMNYARTLRGRSRMDMHYLVARRGRIHHWVERHEMSLFSSATMLRAFRDAGLTVRRIPSRFYARSRIDRGLYLGTRPRSRYRRESPRGGNAPEKGAMDTGGFEPPTSALRKQRSSADLRAHGGGDKPARLRALENRRAVGPTGAATARGCDARARRGGSR
jgi:ubiquinone/menaquinone biosynthesis C-methylase UbiE